MLRIFLSCTSNDINSRKELKERFGYPLVNSNSEEISEMDSFNSVKVDSTRGDLRVSFVVKCPEYTKIEYNLLRMFNTRNGIYHCDTIYLLYSFQNSMGIQKLNQNRLLTFEITDKLSYQNLVFIPKFSLNSGLFSNFK